MSLRAMTCSVLHMLAEEALVERSRQTYVINSCDGSDCPQKQSRHHGSDNSRAAPPHERTSCRAAPSDPGTSSFQDGVLSASMSMPQG